MHMLSTMCSCHNLTCSASNLGMFASIPSAAPASSSTKESCQGFESKLHNSGQWRLHYIDRCDMEHATEARAHGWTLACCRDETHPQTPGPRSHTRGQGCRSCRLAAANQTRPAPSGREVPSFCCTTLIFEKRWSEVQRKQALAPRVGRTVGTPGWISAGPADRVSSWWRAPDTGNM